jgi:hypothetical protein
MDLDKAPFFVTLAVAIAGWSATYVVGRITNSPTLEYQVSQPVASPMGRASDAKTQTIRLTNLTRSSTFKNLTVVLVAQGGTLILSEATEIIPLAPAFEGNEPWRHQGGMARYTIPKMHPGWTFIISVKYFGDKSPALRFESEDTIYSTSARPKSACFETCRRPVRSAAAR